MRWFLFAAAAIVALAAAIDGLFIEPYWIEVTHSQITATVTQPLKIAQLADLHTSGLGRRETSLLNLLDAERPDVIIITGDTITRSWFGAAPHYERIGPLLSRLHAPLGVWLVRGNWENNHPLLRDERTFYAHWGVHFLLNESRPLRRDVWIVGLDDPASGTPDPMSALRNVPENEYAIAAIHGPAFFDQLAGRVPLVLAGHTHGGQMRLPLVPVFWLPFGSGRFLEGWYTDAGSKMYVSRGIGTTGLPIRFRCRPELAIITLVPSTQGR
jgi:predicted MPP superfamily phosphohydrolase